MEFIKIKFRKAMRKYAFYSPLHGNTKWILKHRHTSLSPKRESKFYCDDWLEQIETILMNKAFKITILNNLCMTASNYKFLAF